MELLDAKSRRICEQAPTVFSEILRQHNEQKQRNLKGGDEVD